MKRREFLKAGALVVVGTAAAASGVVAFAATEPKLTTFQEHQGETLLKMTRRIFPHKQLDDAPYWNVVRDIDSAAKADSAMAKLIAEGLEKLDAQGQRFVDLAEKEQTAALKKIETTAFFQKIKSIELQSLYSDPSVWKVLGYQGPAYKYGGYIKRGFDDLAWLPNPPESASPKPA
jgi:Gluconate 2-dehydrogenase subunit 3